MTKLLLGIDEVGRGPWAGPLVVGAVILGHEFRQLPEYQELKDSKKLSMARREQLSEVILTRAVGVGLGWIAAAELDRLGMSASLKLAARRAVRELAEQVQERTMRVDEPAQTSGPTRQERGRMASESAKQPHERTMRVDEIVIDGTVNFLVGTPLEARVTVLPKADMLVKEVSAASIVAKVARDRYMIGLAAQYPGYGFERHMGYGTALHRAALEELGPCPEHRRTFRPVAQLKAAAAPTEYIADQPEAAAVPTEPSAEQPRAATALIEQTAGRRAEHKVAEFLEARGHQIVAQNAKTRTYEIDLVSVLDEKIYFTEVKYRADAAHGTPLAQVTAAKRQQMTYAAEKFLAQHQSELGALAPQLAVAGVTGADFTITDWVPLD